MSASDVFRRLPLALTVLGVAIALIYILFVTNAVPSSGLGNCRPKVSGLSGEASPAHGADARARIEGYLT